MSVKVNFRVPNRVKSTVRIISTIIGAGCGAVLLLGSTCGLFNKAPSVPEISGPSTGVVGVPVEFTATSTDPEEDSVAFQFDWDDGDTSNWTDFVVSGATTAVSHTFTDSTTYSIKAKAKDKSDKESGWSREHATDVLGAGPGYPDSLVAEVYLGGYAGAVVTSTDGEYLYIAHFGDDQVLVMRTTDNTVVDTVPVGDWPHDLKLSPDGDYLYVANLEGDDVTVIRTSDHAVVASIAVGRTLEALDVSPDGKTIYVPCRDEDSLAVIDAITRIVTKKIAVGSGPCCVSVLPDGQSVLVAERLDSTASVVSVTGDSVLATIKRNALVDLVAVAPNGQEAYIGSRDGLLVVVSVEDLTILRTVEVGGNPTQIAFSPDGAYAFVATRQYSKLPVVDVAAHQVVGWLHNDRYLAYIAVSPTGDRVYATDDIRGVYVYAK